MSWSWIMWTLWSRNWPQLKMIHANRVNLSDSSRIEKVKISRRVSAYYMTMRHLPHLREQRSELLMGSCTFRKVSAKGHTYPTPRLSTDIAQLRKPTGLSLLYSDPNCSKQAYLNRHHPHCPPILHYLLRRIPRLSMTLRDQEHLQLMFHRPLYLPPASRLPHHIRTSLPTCPHGITQTYQAIQHHQGRLKAGMALISMHARISIACRRLGLIASGSFSALERLLVPLARFLSRSWMLQI